VYSNVHVVDLARLYGLALRRGSAGAVYHAVADELDFRGIAEAVATVTGPTTRPLTADEASAMWGQAVARTGLSTNSRSRAVVSRAELGWSPVHLDLRADILTASYRWPMPPASCESSPSRSSVTKGRLPCRCSTRRRS
jgi:hypothetical protein